VAPQQEDSLWPSLQPKTLVRGPLRRVRDARNSGYVDIKHVPGHSNVYDIFSKEHKSTASFTQLAFQLIRPHDLSNTWTDLSSGTTSDPGECWKESTSNTNDPGGCRKESGIIDITDLLPDTLPQAALA
jgi:hypothetical protein